jgi:hypothetical protein
MVVMTTGLAVRGGAMGANELGGLNGAVVLMMGAITGAVVVVVAVGGTVFGACGAGVAMLMGVPVDTEGTVGMMMTGLVVVGAAMGAIAVGGLTTGAAVVLILGATTG